MALLRNRPTADLIVMLLACVVGFVVLATTVTVLIAAAVPGGSDLHDVAAQIGDLTSSLIAVIVGYIGGRGAAAMGGTDEPEE